MRVKILLKSLLHNLGVLVVGIGFAFLGRAIDSLLGVSRFDSVLTNVVGVLLSMTGLLLRVWATYFFYQERMRVISLVPQKKLITAGPYRISRNPLYLGGNFFLFLGTVLFLGSPSGIVLTVLNIVLVDFMIRREERQLAQEFGEQWLQYSRQVRRWV